jgi:shikimate dehydrogenase
MITGTTKLLGVIGDPVGHSLSPVMHNAAIAHLGVDYVYLPLPVPPIALPQALAGFEAIGLHGFSVTIPHKQAIIPLMAEVSAIAQAVGAVNTVYWTEKGWSGTNTDIEGFLAPLLLTPQNWGQSSAVILGNGGAARAVVAGCAQLGCTQVKVVGRNAEKLQHFLNSWADSSLQVNLSVHSWEELPGLLPEADLLVNTTPIGMYPKIHDSPLNSAEMEKLPKGAIAYDLTYNPRPTLFLQQAQARGATTLDGLEMLVQQGVAALKLWLKPSAPIPVEVMRQSLLQYLDSR